MKVPSYNVTIETLSPVFIGSGNELTQLDYFQEGDYIYVVDFEELAKILGEVERKDFKDFIDWLTEFVQKNLKDGELKNKEQIFKRGIKERIIKEKKYLRKIRVESPDFHKKTKISEFIKSAGRAYIPGSSIKGAIRSAVLYYVLKSNSEIYETKFRPALMQFINETSDLVNKMNRANNRPLKREIEKKIQNKKNIFNDKLEYFVFGNYAIKHDKEIKEIRKDPFRLLTVSDTDFTDNLSIMDYGVYHLLKKDHDKIPIAYEVIKKDTMLKSNIKLKEDELKTSRQFLNSKIQLNRDFLLKATNTFFRDILRYEIKRAPMLSRDYTSILENFDESGIYLFIGKGNSMITKSIYLLLAMYEDEATIKKYINIVSPKSNINLKEIDFNLRNKLGVYGKFYGGYAYIDKRYTEKQNKVKQFERWYCVIKKKIKSSYFVEPIIKITEMRGQIPFPLTKVSTAEKDILGIIKLKLCEDK
jgi:CRISPR-associated protein Csm5